MTLTATTVGTYLLRRLDGEPSVPVLELCNQAGNHLVGMHKWGWLVRAPASLNLVSGHNYLTLPSDFAEALGQLQSTGTVSFQWSTPEHVAALRASGTESQSCLYGYIVWRTAPGGSGAPRIELGTTPTETVSGAFLLPYRAGWSELEVDSDLIQIPPQFEPFFLDIVFAYAQGYDDSDLGSRSDRLGILESGPEFRALRHRDGATQPSIGSMSGGAVQVLMPYSATTIGWSGVAGDPT